MISPYSQGDKHFQALSRNRADKIFKNYDFYKDVESTNEIIFSNSNKLREKYQGKKIIILGGGPSTNVFLKTRQNYLKHYDYVWSVNHFFLNPILSELRVDLAMMMLEPNILSDEFKKYLYRFKPTLGFELHDKWRTNRIPYQDCFVMQTRFYGILGACQRMIIFAAVLRASEVAFVGLDGLEAIRRGQHSFQEGKTTLPSISRDEIYKSHYDEFYRYIYQFREHTKFINYSGVRL